MDSTNNHNPDLPTLSQIQIVEASSGVNLTDLRNQVENNPSSPPRNQVENNPSSQITQSSVTSDENQKTAP